MKFGNIYKAEMKDTHKINIIKKSSGACCFIKCETMHSASLIVGWYTRWLIQPVLVAAFFQNVYGCTSDCQISIFVTRKKVMAENNRLHFGGDISSVAPHFAEQLVQTRVKMHKQDILISEMRKQLGMFYYIYIYIWN